MSIATKTHGPYGSQASPNFRLKLGPSETITALGTNSGHVVDGIGFDVLDQVTGTTRSVWYGGHEGSEDKVNFQTGEVITQISGIEGKVEGRPHIVHTNLNPKGYGPYGHAVFHPVIQTFSSPYSLRVLEIFGVGGRYLDSIL